MTDWVGFTEAVFMPCSSKPCSCHAVESLPAELSIPSALLRRAGLNHTTKLDALFGGGMDNFYVGQA